MNWTVAALLPLAVVLANLPFLSERLFLVFAYPGFVYRYLWGKPGQ